MTDPVRSDKDILASTRPFAQELRARSWFHVISTFFLLAGATVGAFAVSWWPARVCFSVVEGLLLVRAFILFHDYCHNAILRGSPLAKMIFGAYGLTVLTPMRVWKETHNYHHANNMKFVGSHVGSYPVVTVGMWEKMTPLQRLGYRVSRSPITILIGYLTVFAWGMCLGPFLRAPKKHWPCIVALAVQVVAAFVLIAKAGVTTYLAAWLGPLALATCAGSYLFYAQHNFVGAHLRSRETWTYVAAALEASSYMPMGPIMRFFAGNIGYHHVHHLNPGIPFYRLPEAMAAVPELRHPTETRLTPGDIARTFSLDLYDLDEDRFVTFESERKELA